jgi:hypothetical protein
MARPAGSPNKDKPFRDALRIEAIAAENGEETVAHKGSLRWIARRLLNRAGEETAAAREVGDRLVGKPAQAIENGEDGALEVLHRIETVIVDPTTRDG